MLVRTRKAQSLLEYAVMLGVVVAAIMIMQTYVKRGFQGGLKDSADKLGDQYSVSNSTIVQDRALNEDQNIIEEVATKSGSPISSLATDSSGGAYAMKNALDNGAYSFVERHGNTLSEMREKTDAATQEAFRQSEYQITQHSDFSIDGELNWD